MQDQVEQCDVEGTASPEPVCGTDEKQSITYQLTLAPLDSGDMPLVRAWRNDYKVWKWCRQNDFISDAAQTRWFEKQSNDPTVKMYKIMVAMEKDGKNHLIPVGVCGLTSIDMTNRRAEFSLYIAPAYQGNNFGDQALSCLLTHGFQNLGLHLIWGEVFDKNPAYLKFAKLGFRNDGVKRDFYFRDGKFIDAYMISIKEDEWNTCKTA